MIFFPFVIPAPDGGRGQAPAGIQSTQIQKHAKVPYMLSQERTNLVLVMIEIDPRI